MTEGVRSVGSKAVGVRRRLSSMISATFGVLPRPPAERTWRQLGAFLRLPVLWFILVVLAYWVLVGAGAIAKADRWQATEVFLSVGGIGAAVVAIAGIAKQFEVPLPNAGSKS